MIHQSLFVVDAVVFMQPSQSRGSSKLNVDIFVILISASGVVRTGFVWLRLGTGNSFSWIFSWNFRFCKMPGVAVPGVELRVFQELFSMELVSQWVNQSINNCSVCRQMKQSSSVNRSVGKWINESVSQSSSHSVGQWANQSINPINQSVDQSISQSVSHQSINQSANQ